MRVQTHGAHPIPKTEVVWIESRPFCHNHNRASDLLDPVTIWSLITSVRIGFLNQSPMAAVFLDIAGPFDNVDILLKDLREIGILALSRKFVENLIRHLNFVIDACIDVSCTDHMPIRAHPKGLLSLLLFDINLRDFEQHLHQDTRFLQYANDVILFSTHRDINSHQIHSALFRSNIWLSKIQKYGSVVSKI